METKKFIGGLLAGAAIGIAIGILMAPTTGKDTQQKSLKGSKRLAGDLKHKAGDSIKSLKGQYNGSADETAKKGKETISNAGDRIKA